MFQLNHKYNFTTYAPTVLGGSWKLVKVKAIMGVDEASKYRDVRTVHQVLSTQIPSLPDIESCTFILVENQDHETSVLAVEWIDPSSIVLTDKVTIKVVLSDIDSSEIPMIRNHFLELGYTSINITMV